MHFLSLLLVLILPAVLWNFVVNVMLSSNPFSDQFERTMSTLGFGESVLQRHYVSYLPSIGDSTRLDQDIAHAIGSDIRGVRVLALPFGAGKCVDAAAK